MKVRLKELKPGNGVTHPKYGYMQYRGLAQKNPFTDDPKIPYQYVFWLGVDADGRNQPDVVLKNANEFVTLEDDFEN